MLGGGGWNLIRFYKKHHQSPHNLPLFSFNGLQKKALVIAVLPQTSRNTPCNTARKTLTTITVIFRHNREFQKWHVNLSEPDLFDKLILQIKKGYFIVNLNCGHFDSKNRIMGSIKH